MSREGTMSEAAEMAKIIGQIVLWFGIGFALSFFVGQEWPQVNIWIRKNFTKIVIVLLVVWVIRQVIQLF